MIDLVISIVATCLLVWALFLAFSSGGVSRGRLAKIVSLGNLEKIQKAINRLSLSLKFGGIALGATGAWLLVVELTGSGEVVWDRILRGYSILVVGIFFCIHSIYLRKLEVAIGGVNGSNGTETP